jgi:dTDP-4-dehydrorhamnose 3,5-epimerase
VGVKALPGVLVGTIVFEPAPHHDDHGFVTRTFDAELAATVGLDGRSLVQDTQVRIYRGAVRGLSLRTDGGEGRLVRCASGAVVNVAVDLRPGSVTYRSWMTVVLDDADHRSVWLPAGLAHGFQALTAQADVCLRVNRVQQPHGEVVIRYDDPELAIPWPLPVTAVCDQDRRGGELAAVEPFLSEWFGALR